MSDAMKAYIAGYANDEWITVVHGETVPKAKRMFAMVDPSTNYDRSRWVDIRLIRLPEWDNRPFVPGQEYNELFAPDSDEDGNVVDMLVDCRCELCKGAERDEARERLRAATAYVDDLVRAFPTKKFLDLIEAGKLDGIRAFLETAGVE
jgi:hypothetical protein